MSPSHEDSLTFWGIIMMNRDTVKKGLSSLYLFFFLIGTAYAQQRVQGTVTSADDGNPLPGVNITVKNTTIGTSTGTNGNYSLNVPDTSNVLVFSFIGFQTREVQINGRSRIDVALETQVYSPGEEIVVVGYGTQQKSDLTGSVSSVDAEEISQIPTSNLQDALQGKVAGVQITPSSGRPGSQPDVRIRGVGTLNNASPLYVVDGMLLDDISFINSKNIESVQVLKDASATAIYGSRGANGVIIVTTKSGREGAPQVTANSYYGVQRINNKIEVANAREFATLVNESTLNSDPNSPVVFQNPDQFGEGFDWQDFIYNDQAPIQNHQVTASGGSENFVYNISADYYKQDGAIRGSKFQRVSLRLNNEYFLSNFVNVGHNISFTFDDSKDEPGQIVNSALWADPTLTPRNEDGEFTNTNQNGGAGNPAASLFYNENDNFGFRAVGNAYIDINFLNYFSFRSSFGLDWDREEMTNFTPEFFVSPIQQNTQNRLRVEDEKRTNWLSENTLKYKRDLGDHGLDLLAGLTFQEFTSEDLGGSRTNLPSSDPALRFLGAGDEDSQTNFNGSFSWGIISYLFRANYNYDDRYLFTGTYRIDGSSRFSEKNRYGYFPSVAVGWRLSNEAFMQDVSYISNLKLRASWGRIGNDKIDTDAATPTVNSGLNAVFGEDENINSGATPTSLANTELKWEEAEQIDIGLELGLLESRLTAEVDWYRKETKDILTDPPIPGHVGAPAPVVNAASVLNRGFDFNLGWQNSNRKFSYKIGFTGSTVHNEVLSLGQGKEEIFDGSVRNLGNTTRTVVGQPIGAFYGFKVIGVFQTPEEIADSPTRSGQVVPGDIRLADINGFDENGELTGQPDGVINDADRTFLGSPVPDFLFGVNFSASYKSFDFSLSLDGQTGNQVLSARKAIRGFRILNYEESFLDRWTGPGTSNSEPRVTEAGRNYVTDRFLEDGDFLRLRNIQLGYTLPVNITSALTVKNIRLYANATNVLTFTGYSGYNPQIGGGDVTETGIDEGVYPIASSYTFGIELSF